MRYGRIRGRGQHGRTGDLEHLHATWDRALHAQRASPASHIGLGPTDIITSLNGQPVTSAGTLTALLNSCQPNDRATISFIRDGKTMHATIVVSNQPAGS